MQKVGSTLKSVLSNTWGIRPCPACHETAIAMDQLTPQQIRDDIDNWAERLHQNAKQQKWTSLMGAAVRFLDTAASTVSGNALYSKIILDVCNYCERANQPCVHLGERVGVAPWNKSLERYRCGCAEVEYGYCIQCPMSALDKTKAPFDGVAICSLCPNNKKLELT